MDTPKYFRVISTSGNVLHTEFEGFWSDELVNLIGERFLEQFKKGVDEVSARGSFIVLADFSNLNVLTQKGRAVVSKMMRYVKEHGLYKAVEVIPSAITALSVREAAERSGKDNFRIVVRSLEEGEAMVEKLEKELKSP